MEFIVTRLCYNISRKIKPFHQCNFYFQSTNMTKLSQKTCIPCSGGVSPLSGKELDDLYQELVNGWSIVDEHHLEKLYKFPNFVEALGFTNAVGNLAEEQNHHPDIYLAWGKVMVAIWTHKINGLTESDFVFAAKSDDLLNP